MSEVLKVISQKNLKSKQRVNWEMSLYKRLPLCTTDSYFIIKFDEISANKNYSTFHLKYKKLKKRYEGASIMKSEIRLNLVWCTISFRQGGGGGTKIKVA